jgi:preprotein translocase SecE subunit
MARDLSVSAGGARKPPAPEPRPVNEVQGRRGGPIGFVQESWAELQKVEWPTQSQVIQGTVVVIVACIIVGVFLYLNDELWKTVVQKLLLK